MTTQWDDELCYLLSPALAAYEHEHSLGVSVGNEEFQNAIRRNVPDGHTFKGFPIQFIHRNAARAFATCLRFLIHIFVHDSSDVNNISSDSNQT